MRLKVGAIVILLRTLNINAGLINGTRLNVIGLHENAIALKVITGQSAGNVILLPRIDLTPSDTTLPFKLKRRQFPVKLAFAMTINKAQGQTFDKVRLYLPEPVFSHGQLYVALYKVKDPRNLRIKLSSSYAYTQKIVFNEVLN